MADSPPIEQHNGAARTVISNGIVGLRRRPRGALSHKPPTARLNQLNNPLGSYS